VSLVNELNARGIDADAFEGAKSQFDVVRGDDVVFSKQREGRFPELDDILTRI
jgi:hypothetical protein